MKPFKEIGILFVVLLFATACTGDQKKGGLSGDPKFVKDGVASSANPLGEQLNKDGIPTGPTTTIKFDHMEHDFGKIKQNTKNEHIFTFINTGEHPLVFSGAKGSCGCTVPQYPETPVLPGDKGEIKVVFSSGKKKLKQNKQVTLTANTNPAKTYLKIKAFVEVDEAPSANNK